MQCKTHKTLTAIIFTLMLSSSAYADLFADFDITTDEDAYVNINVNTTGDLNMTETYNQISNEYYTTVSSGGYSRKRMLNDQSELLDHFTGHETISTLDRWEG